ncbi:glycosyltransferase [uncultured Pseudomonas sp.]|uniref:glycosyltransferase n=1 Tax=uncultured Pseudomonas sp. TaxID=114707 RepID=UPI0025E1F528|nr:glycosyltransferase [uncultured Pseudomonas sp.]
MADSQHASQQSFVLFATADWDEPYWTNKQHSAQALAALNFKVLYVESVGLRAPRRQSARDWGRLKDRLVKGLKSLLLGASERQPNIYVLSPLLIPAGYRHPALRYLNKLLLRWSLSRSMKLYSLGNPAIWTYHPFMLDILGYFKKPKILYHCVDDLGAVPGVDSVKFAEEEEKLLKMADTVFATAPALARRCLTLNPNSHYLSNVVDIEHFGKALEPAPIPEEVAAISEPRIVYHGVLSDFKMDFSLILDAARRRPDWSWVFIGEEREGQRSQLLAEIARLPNVHFLGYRNYQELPSYLRGMQVGILPSLINKYTDSMFPMKYYEYLAAGLPVVATPLNALRDQVHHIEFGETADDFCMAIHRQLQQGALSRAQIADVVGDNTWMGRTQKMVRALNNNTQERHR